MLLGGIHTVIDSFTSLGRLESFSAAAVDEYRAETQLALDERNAVARRLVESRKAIARCFQVVTKKREDRLVTEYRAVYAFCRSTMTPISRRKSSYRLASRIRRDVIVCTSSATLYFGLLYLQSLPLVRVQTVN